MAGRRDALEREKETVEAMLQIYCRENHKGAERGLCADCSGLLDYAKQRLSKCPFGAGKGPCSKCAIHCYKPEMRRRIQDVMRYSGPRMLKRHPLMAVRHLLKGWRGKANRQESD